MSRQSDRNEHPHSDRQLPAAARNVVATSQPLAVKAGVDILRSGGNAVDAALAAAITLTVVEPTSNGIGSDAFAIVWDGHELHGLNGSGRSPRSLDINRFAGRERMPELGWDTVTVPGAVDTWITLSRRFGRLPFRQLFDTAIDHATRGFRVTPITAAAWARAETRFRDCPDFAPSFLPGGHAPAAGDLFICPGQADTLAVIAESEGESFYRGELALKIAAHARATGGVLDSEDLAAHRSDWVGTISRSYRGLALHEIPPNGQGLAALIALGVLERLDIRRLPLDDPDLHHAQIEAMKIGLAEAARHVADPDHLVMTPAELLTDNLLAARAAEIDPARAGEYTPTLPSERGTVYLTTADESGMMVSFIQSNFWGFGSGIVVPDTGISLQNRGFGFTLESGHPNQVAGGKRPFHTIIPGFVMQGGAPLMSFGVMGGPMQAQGHLQMMVRVFDYGQHPQAASDAPRWQIMENGEVALEVGFDAEVAAQLKRRGHRVVENRPATMFGGAQLILKQDDGCCAGSDHRKDGLAAGF
ncbi:MAG: gamma-glutamyltransferase family protein [bacterium]|nr:gamma-glutamyltransferase family protein [bacterium]